MKRLSIRKQLFALLVPFVFGLWIASAVLSFWLVSNFSRESFDRDLINSADSVVGRLRVKDRKMVVDLPPAALAILKHDESDRFYFCVLDSGGQRVSGDAGLPAPSPELQTDIPKVVTARIDGKEVRLAEIKAKADGSASESVIVQVAATTNVRNRFQQKMLLSIAVPQLLVITVGLLTVWYGIATILTPLRLLQKQVINRSQFDLSRLSDDTTPEEVYPLVRALNLLLDRLRDGVKAHERFIANAAHQLRTPLAGLKTYSSIGSEMSDPKDLKHIVHELDQGIDRASRIVSQLLALARTDGTDSSKSKTKDHIDLNFLVSDVVAELVDQAIRKDLELTYEAAAAPATILGEQSGLRDLIANLIENAVWYTPQGGTVVVRINSNNGHVVVSVADTGPGIAEEEREKVFERFYRVVGTQGNGSGLGLAIVKEVANVHNAKVSIESGPGSKGTRVSVEFSGNAD